MANETAEHCWKKKRGGIATIEKAEKGIYKNVTIFKSKSVDSVNIANKKQANEIIILRRITKALGYETGCDWRSSKWSMEGHC